MTVVLLLRYNFMFTESRLGWKGSDSHIGALDSSLKGMNIWKEMRWRLGMRSGSNLTGDGMRWQQ